MSIRRTHLAFEDHYTQLPNAWVRDKRLSRKARGLLSELMSHRAGWDITIGSLVEGGPEGRDAVRTGLQELERCGYLERRRERLGDGTLAGTDYEIADPWAEKPESDGPTPDNPALVNQGTKKTIPTEDHSQEHSPRQSAAEYEQRAFDQAWQAWPRSEGKQAAIKAFKTAITHRTGDGVSRADAVTALLTEILRFGMAYRITTEKSFVPHLSSWLNGKRWTDPLPEARGTSLPSHMQEQVAPPAPELPMTARQQMCPLHPAYPVPCDRCRREAEGVL